jgi:S-adenosylmethionine-diacylglycerol 3-amino-3-carboxypropyl transferase
MAFFEHINYAASHEDGRSELRALALDASSRVLCITGSGSRALDLLVARPRELVAIDFNPAQTQLLALKLAAMRALSYTEYVGFIGLVAHSERLALYARVRPRLAPAARAFWDRRRSILARGVLYCGRWERFLRAMVAPAAFARRGLIARVFACRSLDEQRSLWLREWNTPGWDRYLGLLANRFMWTRIVREPGMRHIPPELDIVRCIRARFDRAAGSYLFRDSAWAWLVFHGRLNPDGPLPPHLQREHFDVLAAEAASVKLVSVSLLSYLEGPGAGSFSAFSLSDFGSYADDASYAATHRAVHRAALPGARLCERQFLVPRDPTRIPGLSLVRDAALERELAQHDNSVVYDFVAGSVPITS